VGWTKAGTRPTFKLVTGISTGALTAPFAYLGPEYDAQLREVYTQTGADDVFTQRNLLAAVTNDAMADTTPLLETILRFLTAKMVADIAREHGKGRLLLVMTTNLGAGQPVIWNIGAIAASDVPNKRDTIARILQASAAIPGAFPPVMLDVTVDGTQYQEMHVDGGAVAQAFLYPPALHINKLAKKSQMDRKRHAYVIRNGRLNAPFAGVNRQTIAIAGRAISTMIASSGVNDTYRIYAIAQRDGVDFNLAYIGDDFTDPYKGPFDKGYMTSLFEYGYRLGAAGYRWQKTPPGDAEP
jgi:patatin-like phospholipase/acyl hydrolase